MSHRCAKPLDFVTTIERSADIMFFVAKNNNSSTFFALFCTRVSSDPTRPFTLQFSVTKNDIIVVTHKKTREFPSDTTHRSIGIRKGRLAEDTTF